MGEMHLAALLGHNQSFDAGGSTDVPPGWERRTDAASFFHVASASAVHSSAVGLAITVDSTAEGADVLRYRYPAPEDPAAAWDPAVTTHSVTTVLWARMGEPASSGGLRWVLAGQPAVATAPLAYAAGLQPYRVETLVTSATHLPALRLERVNQAMAPATAAADDVLTLADAVALHAEWSLAEQQRAARAWHRTADATLHPYAVPGYPVFRIPLRWVSAAHAARINGWWARQTPLAFVLDTSDAAAVHPCRIVNARQPIGRREPFHAADGWQGTLELEGLTGGGLAF